MGRLCFTQLYLWTLIKFFIVSMRLIELMVNNFIISSFLQSEPFEVLKLLESWKVFFFESAYRLSIISHKGISKEQVSMSSSGRFHGTEVKVLINITFPDDILKERKFLFSRASLSYKLVDIPCISCVVRSYEAN